MCKSMGRALGNVNSYINMQDLTLYGMYYNLSPHTVDKKMCRAGHTHTHTHARAGGRAQARNTVADCCLSVYLYVYGQVALNAFGSIPQYLLLFSTFMLFFVVGTIIFPQGKTCSTLLWRWTKAIN